MGTGVFASIMTSCFEICSNVHGITVKLFYGRIFAPIAFTIWQINLYITLKISDF